MRGISSCQAKSMRSLNLRLQNVPSPPIWGSAGISEGSDWEGSDSEEGEQLREISRREVDGRIFHPWPRTIDHGWVVIGRINDVRIGRHDYDVGPVVSTHDLVVRCQVARFL